LAVIAEALSYQTTTQSERLQVNIARCPEASLYTGGFLSDADRRRATAVAQQSPESLSNFSEQNGFFDDDRLENLFLNYRARHALDTLTEQELSNWAADCAERLFDEDDVPWRTFHTFDAVMAETEWSDKNDSLREDLLLWRETVLEYAKNPSS